MNAAAGSCRIVCQAKLLFNLWCWVNIFVYFIANLLHFQLDSNKTITRLSTPLGPEGCAFKVPRFFKRSNVAQVKYIFLT